jgi:putative endonuclease
MSAGLYIYMEFYIYILYSESSDIYYVGYSDDFRRRFEQHNNSEKVTFTSKHRPWILKAVYSCGAKQAGAMKIEKFIKKQKSRRLVEKLIVDGEFTGILAQLVRVPHVQD